MSRSSKSFIVKAERCVVCNGRVYFSEKLVADNKIYHKSCLRCDHCSRVLRLGNYAALEGKIYCKPHFKQLFKLKGNYASGFGNETPAESWAKTKGGVASSAPAASSAASVRAAPKQRRRPIQSAYVSAAEQSKVQEMLAKDPSAKTTDPGKTGADPGKTDAVPAWKRDLERLKAGTAAKSKKGDSVADPRKESDGLRPPASSPRRVASAYRGNRTMPRRVGGKRPSAFAFFAKLEGRTLPEEEEEEGGKGAETSGATDSEKNGDIKKKKADAPQKKRIEIKVDVPQKKKKGVETKPISPKESTALKENPEQKERRERRERRRKEKKERLRKEMEELKRQEEELKRKAAEKAKAKAKTPRNKAKSQAASPEPAKERTNKAAETAQTGKSAPKETPSEQKPPPGQPADTPKEKQPPQASEAGGKKESKVVLSDLSEEHLQAVFSKALDLSTRVKEGKGENRMTIAQAEALAALLSKLGFC